jgi:hypothetical protein
MLVAFEMAGHTPTMEKLILIAALTRQSDYILVDQTNGLPRGLRLWLLSGEQISAIFSRGFGAQLIGARHSNHASLASGVSLGH